MWRGLECGEQWCLTPVRPVIYIHPFRGCLGNLLFQLPGVEVKYEENHKGFGKEAMRVTPVLA